MSPGFRLLLGCVAVVIASDAMQARARCGMPIVNKQGFRPGTTVMYTVGPSPDGTPFPEGRIKCVQRAFDEWSRANSASSLNVRFVWGHDSSISPKAGGILVRRDKPGGLALRAKRGGGWMQPLRSEDGYLEGATIWLSSDPRLIDSCMGITKVLLHEIGHLHGLGDNAKFLDASVMNKAGGRNDRGNRIPKAPSTCDAAQALNASVHPGVLVASSMP